MSDKTSQFEEAQFTRILEVLKRERKAIALNRYHRWVFYLFSFVVLVNIFLIFSAFAYRILETYLFPFSNPIKFLQPLIRSFKEPFIISLCLAPFLLLLNIPLIIKIFKQRRLWRQLGLKKILDEKRQARTGLSKLLGGLYISAGIIGICIIIWILYEAHWGSSPPAGEEYYFVIFLIIGILIIYISLPFIRFGKEQLVWLSELASELASMEESLLQVRHQAREEGIEGIKIAPADLKRLAVVEQSVIRQDRDQAISSFRNKKVPEYTVLKSLESSKSIANLDLERRLRVEEEIQHLAEDPQPPESYLDRAGGFCRLPVPDTLLQILYSVDQVKRQVKVILLETLPGNEISSAGNGGRHA